MGPAPAPSVLGLKETQLVPVSHAELSLGCTPACAHAVIYLGIDCTDSKKCLKSHEPVCKAVLEGLPLSQHVVTAGCELST